jgi:hypothetical protein
MAFTYKDYGTFTGPNSISGDYNYDVVSKENFWYTDLPEDVSFKLTDLAAVLFHAPGDYVGFYCNGTSTQLMTLAHSTGNIPTLVVKADNTILTGKILANEKIICNGSILANATITLTGVGDVASNINLAKTLPAKPFDIPHPSKEGNRLRHVSLEGPEIGVYFRGKSTAEVIELPDYWKDLVHEDSITVNLTPAKYFQHLYVERIEDNKVYIGGGMPTNGAVKYCYHYTVYAERKDMDKLIVEYEGQSPKDYPGQDWLNLRGQ